MLLLNVVCTIAALIFFLKIFFMNMDYFLSTPHIGLASLLLITNTNYGSFTGGECSKH